MELPRYTLFLGFSRNKDATTEFSKIETGSGWADLDNNSTEVGVGPTPAPTLGGDYWARELPNKRKREPPARREGSRNRNSNFSSHNSNNNSHLSKDLCRATYLSQLSLLHKARILKIAKKRNDRDYSG